MAEKHCICVSSIPIHAALCISLLMHLYFVYDTYFHWGDSGRATLSATVAIGLLLAVTGACISLLTARGSERTKSLLKIVDGEGRKQKQIQSTQILNARVISSEIAPTGDHIVYNLKVTFDDFRNEIVRKRFKEFREFHKSLVKEVGKDAEALSVPPKAILGNFNAAFVKKRQSQLDQYVQHIVSLESCNRSSSWRHFLCSACDLGSPAGTIDTEDLPVKQKDD
eukprot:Rmarinus@m.18967